jgi:hypothetical protein
VVIDGLTLRNNRSVTYNVYWAGLALIYIPANVNYVRNLRLTHCRFQTVSRACFSNGGYIDTFEIANNFLDSMAETGFYMAGHAASNGTIHHNVMGATLPATLGDGMSLRLLSNCRVHHNVIVGAANNGIFFRGPACSDVDVESNTVSGGTGTSSGVVVEQGVRIGIRGNHIDSQPGHGIYVGGFVGQGAITGLVIDGNDVSRSSIYGILCEQQSSRPANVSVSNNRLWDNVEGLQANGLTGTVLVRGNLMVYTAGGQASYGLAVLGAAGSTATVVKGNVTRGYTAHALDTDPSVTAGDNDFLA